MMVLSGSTLQRYKDDPGALLKSHYYLSAKSCLAEKFIGSSVQVEYNQRLINILAQKVVRNMSYVPYLTRPVSMPEAKCPP